MIAGARNPDPGAGSGSLDLMSLAREDGRATPELIQELLREVIDPEIGINIIDLGLVYDVGLSSNGVASIRMTLTTPGCPLGGYIDDEIHNILWGAPGVEDIDVRIVWEPRWDPDEMMSDWAKDQLGWRR